MCLHQTLSMVVHCMAPRATSLSLGPLQSTRGPLPIANVGPSRADSSRSTPRTKGETRASLRARALAVARTQREEELRASLFLSPQEGGGCEPPSSLLEPVPVGGYCPYTPPLIPILPFPHLACQNTDGWDWGQADGQSTCPTAAPPTPNGIWEERLYAQSPGHGTRRLLRVAGRFPPGAGGARPDFCLLFVNERGAPFISPHT